MPLLPEWVLPPVGAAKGEGGERERRARGPHEVAQEDELLDEQQRRERGGAAEDGQAEAGYGRELAEEEAGFAQPGGRKGAHGEAEERDEGAPVVVADAGAEEAAVVVVPGDRGVR